MIDASERYEKKRVQVKGSSMAYVEVGAGDPIVFLHGNPTSSYLWRNVIPYLERLGRCIAPDLIGMGDSDKLTPSGPNRYRFVEHREYLDALLDAVGVSSNATLVLHDWGSALGFDWARRHERSVKGIAYMEGFMKTPHWADQEEQFKQVFQALRSPAGEPMILEQNLFIEQILPSAILRRLTAEEMAVYRRSYVQAGEDRRPMLTWPREIPFDGEPSDVEEIVEQYARWLPICMLPKLFINAEPGTLMAQKGWREFCRTFVNQSEITVQGLHFIQEDCPDEIGTAIAGWLRRLG